MNETPTLLPITHDPRLLDIDPVGMRKAYSGRGVAATICELVSNGLDTHASNVSVEIVPEGIDHARVTVSDDDPNGFADIRHAYTVFAESNRKDDPNTRGRFNIGEKFVIVLCEESSLTTTTGTVRFDATGRTNDPNVRTASGSVFTGLMPMTYDDKEATIALLRRIIIPAGVTVTVNGVALAHRKPVKAFKQSLITVLGDNLRRTRRSATVTLYAPLPGHKPTLYELGIPVVETDIQYDIDIAQKVPLNTERDNVTAGFLRDLAPIVFCNAYTLLATPDFSAPWVYEATGHPLMRKLSHGKDAMAAAYRARHGEDAVLHSSRDTESNRLSQAIGHVVVSLRGLAPGERENVRFLEPLLPADMVTPSPTLEFNDLMRDRDPGDVFLPESKWTPAERRVVAYARFVGERVLGFAPAVQIMDEAAAHVGGTFSPMTRTLTLNRAMGRRWFAEITPDTDALLFHEYAHNRVADHLDARFADEIARLSSMFVQIALDDPASVMAVRSPERMAALAAADGFANAVGACTHHHPPHAPQDLRPRRLERQRVPRLDRRHATLERMGDPVFHRRHGVPAGRGSGEAPLRAARR